MLALIGILLCFLIVFKAFEILQIAYCSEGARGLPLGVIAVIVSLIIAFFGISALLNASTP